MRRQAAVHPVWRCDSPALTAWLPPGLFFSRPVVASPLLPSFRARVDLVCNRCIPPPPPSAGLRPFGTSILFMGHDKHHGFQLYQSDPSGNFGGWLATCIGANSQVRSEATAAAAALLPNPIEPWPEGVVLASTFPSPNRAGRREHPQAGVQGGLQPEGGPLACGQGAQQDNGQHQPHLGPTCVAGGGGMQMTGEREHIPRCCCQAHPFPCALSAALPLPHACSGVCNADAGGREAQVHGASAGAGQRPLAGGAAGRACSPSFSSRLAPGRACFSTIQLKPTHLKPTHRPGRGDPQGRGGGGAQEEGGAGARAQVGRQEVGRTAFYPRASTRSTRSLARWLSFSRRARPEERTHTIKRLRSTASAGRLTADGSSQRGRNRTSRGWRCSRQGPGPGAAEAKGAGAGASGSTTCAPEPVGGRECEREKGVSGRGDSPLFQLSLSLFSLSFLLASPRLLYRNASAAAAVAGDRSAAPTAASVRPLPRRHQRRQRGGAKSPQRQQRNDHASFLLLLSFILLFLFLFFLFFFLFVVVAAAFFCRSEGDCVAGDF